VQRDTLRGFGLDLTKPLEAESAELIALFTTMIDRTPGEAWLGSEYCSAC
jgi:hypothetical protein